MKICDKQFDEERALYNLENSEVTRCVFQGEADGESALKETRNVTVSDCQFHLRYPLWHGKKLVLLNCVLHEPCRAPLWYDEDGVIENCEIKSIKAVRECRKVTVRHCKLSSPEFGWKCRNLAVHDCDVFSDYLFLDSDNVTAEKMTLHGKYSFQYMHNVKVTDCELYTKDAFWHSENVYVKNCKVSGEYLGWYSKNLTFENCEISGTQPLCYCKNLKLINCTMVDCDLAFEYSDVQADIRGTVLSVKNPESGKIVADGYGSVILDSTVRNCRCNVCVRKGEK